LADTRKKNQGYEQGSPKPSNAYKELIEREQVKSRTYRLAAKEKGPDAIEASTWKELKVEMGKWCKALYDEGMMPSGIQKDKKHVPESMRNQFLTRLHQIVQASRLNAGDWRDLESSVKTWTNDSIAIEWVKSLKSEYK